MEMGVVNDDAQLPYVEEDDSDDEDEEKISEAYKQVLETYEDNLSAIDYQAEVEKRGMPFKYGLIEMYLCKFPFEDEEYLPNSFYYYNPKGRQHINAHEQVKRFLKQIRESNGYDVDCFPAGVYSPLFPGFHVLKEKPFHDHMMEFTHFAIEKINAETGKTYEAVEIENANYTSYSLYLLTFTVKNGGTVNDATLEAIRAMVYAPYPYKDDYALKEWMLKPSIKGRVDVDPGKKKARIGDI